MEGMVLHTNFECDICDYAYNFQRTLGSHNTRKRIKEVLKKRKLMKNQQKCHRSMVTEYFFRCEYCTCIFQLYTKIELIQNRKLNILMKQNTTNLIKHLQLMTNLQCILTESNNIVLTVNTVIKTFKFIMDMLQFT